MIVVSDTTPIHYLILIDEESILSELFKRIVIPDAVIREMSHPNAPEQIRRWAANPPEWIEIEKPNEGLASGIVGLGAGETAAIALATDLRADAVLMDDRKAIREALRRDLTVLTTFALFELASRKGLIDRHDTVDALSKTSFHFPPDDVVEEYLRRNEKR